MKTIIGINTLTAVEQVAYANHVQFFYRLGKHYPNDSFALNTPRRMSIDRMRNYTAKVAVENDFDYLLFLDDDVIVPVDSFDKLLKADKDIIAGWTLIRGYPFKNMFFTYEGKENNLICTPDGSFTKGEVVDVAAVGFSYCLIKVSLLKKVPPPWFVTGTHNTEDIYFCVKSKKFVPDCTIAVDTSIETAHIMGPEFIAPFNKGLYTDYLKTAFPEMAQEEQNPWDTSDRSEEYLERMKQATSGAAGE